MTARLHMIPPTIRHLMRPASTLPLIRAGADIKPAHFKGAAFAVRCLQSNDGFWYGETYTATVIASPAWPKGKLLLQGADGNPVMAEASDFEPVNATRRRFFPHLTGRLSTKMVAAIAVDEFGWETPIIEGRNGKIMFCQSNGAH